MSTLVHFVPAPSTTMAQYDETIRRLEAEGDFPPNGLDTHICVGSNGGIRVSEIWDSKEQFEAFGERLMPVLSEVGIEPGEPEVIDIHKLIKR